MCKLASFIFKPTEQMEVRTYVITGHSETLEHFKVSDDKSNNAWREGHYLPDGTIECRVIDGDILTSEQCQKWVKSQWPTFIDFLNWHFKNNTECGSLDLRSLTDAKGLTLPEKCGSLYLSSLTDANGLTLPKEISGSLDLRSDLKKKLGIK